MCIVFDHDSYITNIRTNCGVRTAFALYSCTSLNGYICRHIVARCSTPIPIQPANTYTARLYLHCRFFFFSVLSCGTNCHICYFSPISFTDCGDIIIPSFFFTSLGGNICILVNFKVGR